MAAPTVKRNVQYEKALIAYIDILGFKELIATRTANQMSRTLRIFREHSNPGKYRGLYVPTTIEYLTNFSDLCIIAVPYGRNVGRMGGAAWSLIVRLLRVQGSLIMRHGIFVRGGITVGEMTRSYRQLFGPGIIQAYQLEQAALQPRIVVDPCLLQELANTPHLWYKERDQELRIVNDVLRTDAGEPLPYIDYLKEMQSDPWPDHTEGTFAEAHLRLIQDALTRYDTQPRVRAKYEWLRRYHAQVTGQ